MGRLRQGWFLGVALVVACGGTVRRNSDPAPSTAGSGSTDPGFGKSGSGDSDPGDPDPGANDPKSRPPVLCTYADQTYPVGESFPASDACNHCTCLADGNVSCTEVDCVAQCQQLEQQTEAAFLHARTCNVDSDCSSAREDACGCGVPLNPAYRADIVQAEQNRDLLKGMQCPIDCLACSPLGSTYCMLGLCFANANK